MMYLKTDHNGLHIEIAADGAESTYHAATRPNTNIHVSRFNDDEYAAVMHFSNGGSRTTIHLNEEQLEELKSKLEQI